MAEIKGFVFYKDWADILDALDDDEQVGILMKLVLEYFKTGKRPQLKGALRMAFTIISGQIDRDTEKYNENIEKKRSAGSKGGKARAARQQESTAEPDTAEPDTAEPETAEPDTAEPETAEPETAEPETPEPEQPQAEPSTAMQNEADQAIENETIKEIKRTIKNIRERENIKETESKSTAACADGAMVPPSLKDIEMFCYENKIQIDAEAFYAHYQANGWMIGSTPMKDWQSAVKSWEKKSYNTINSPKRSKKTDDDYFNTPLSNGVPRLVDYFELVSLAESGKTVYDV